MNKSTAGAASKITESEKSCWERIRDQHQANSDYLAENRIRLNNIVGEWYYAKNDSQSDRSIQESSHQGMFFLALAKSALLEGSTMEQDEESALLLLEQVAAADPQNSAPLIYAAIIEKRRGNQARAEELLSEADKTKHFDSYLKDFTFTLFDGVKTPSDLLSVQEIWSSAPVPNYLSLQEIVNESKQANIAKQLINDGLRVDRERITDLTWIPIEYAVGKKLLESLQSETDVPEYRELLRKHPSTLGEIAERAVAKLDSTCDLESIESEVDNIRKYLGQARIKGL